MTLKAGDKVSVFNKVASNWEGEIVRVNSKSYTVKADRGPMGTRPIFTHHRDARPPLDDGSHFIVKEHDLRPLTP